jgi:beta-xylosidase
MRRPATFTNPLPELRMGDPFVGRFGEQYFLTGTTRAGRGFEAWASQDLVSWTPQAWIYQSPSDGWADGSFWAPELFRRGDRFFLAYSARRRDAKERPGFRLALAEADSPTGPFVHRHGPWCDDGHAAIDAHVFFDDDVPYLYYARVGQPHPKTGQLRADIRAVRLEDDLSNPASEIVLCVGPEQAWETPAAGRSLCNEGPFVFKEAGRYFMTFSAGHWAEPYYAIGYAVADSPLGPWRKPIDGNPLATSDPTLDLSGPGHCSVVRTPDGELWMAYHAHLDPADPPVGRTVNLDRLRVEGDRLILDGPTRAPQAVPVVG